MAVKKSFSSANDLVDLHLLGEIAGIDVSGLEVENEVELMRSVSLFFRSFKISSRRRRMGREWSFFRVGNKKEDVGSFLRYDKKDSKTLISLKDVEAFKKVEIEGGKLLAFVEVD